MLPLYRFLAVVLRIEKAKAIGLKNDVIFDLLSVYCNFSYS